MQKPNDTTSQTADANGKIRHIVRSDLNLEKWNIFGTKESKGYRELKREFNLPGGARTVQVVKIGLPGSKQTLTAEEAKIFYLLLDCWNKSGRNPEGIVTGSLREIFSLYFGKNKPGYRFGTWQKTWFKKKLDRLRTVPISFENAYHDKTSGEYRDKTFTLLTDVNLFERKAKGKGRKAFFDHSTFVINKAVITSILARQMKPIILSVITRLRHQISVILYRYLDLVMADKVRAEFRLDRLQEEFQFGAARMDNFVRQMREACAELQGQEITTGKLGICTIEKTEDRKNWKLVVTKQKRDMLINIPVAPRRPVTEKTDENFDELIMEAQAYMAALGDEDREKLETLRDQYVKERYHSMGGELTAQSALVDAVQAFKSGIRGGPATSPAASDDSSMPMTGEPDYAVHSADALQP